MDGKCPVERLPVAFPDFDIDEIRTNGDIVVVQAHSTARSGICPYCGQATTRVHSYYQRSPRDLAWSGHKVRWLLRVHRFRCSNEACQHHTFAERLPQVVPVHGQRTMRLTTTLQALAFELSAEAGARVSRHFNMAVSGDTLRRIVRQTELAPIGPVRVVGVDDWAFKKGDRYGTLVVDLEQHQPLDLLPDRTATTLATWLKARPSIAVVSRDRSGEYTAGITQGAPQAIQVADRGHLLRNLGDAVQRVLARHPKALWAAAQQATVQPSVAAPAPPEPEQLPTPNTPDPPQPTARQLRFTEVKTLAAQGNSTRAIAHQLHLHRSTVARYRQLEALPQRTTPQNRSSVAPYLADLHRRWVDAGHNAQQVWRELCAQGYTGSYMSVYRAVRHFPDYPQPQWSPTTSQPTTPTLSARQAMWLLVDEPDHLTDEQLRQRQALCEQCPEAALVLEWSNGQVEGQVNRLKVIKRVMYGRAKFDLLRLRVLHPP